MGLLLYSLQYLLAEKTIAHACAKFIALPNIDTVFFVCFLC